MRKRLLTFYLCLFLQILVPHSCLAGDSTPVSPDELAQHELFMTKAPELARPSGLRGNHPVSSVPVRDGRLVATSQDTEITDGDVEEAPQSF